MWFSVARQGEGGRMSRRSLRKGASLGAIFAVLIAAGGPVALGTRPARADSGNGGCAVGAQATQPDFNFDGFADLAVGVPWEDIGFARGVKDSGAVHVIYGSGSDLQATGTGAPDDQLWYQDGTDALDLSESKDRFGAALAWGDFNGDAYSDLAVGVPGESVLGTEEGDVINLAGAVHVFYGSSSGLQATGLGAPDDQLFTEFSPIGGSTPELGDNFGSSLASGDFNNDDYCDLAVGIPNEDYVTPDGVTLPNWGALTVIYGSGAGLDNMFVPRQLFETFNEVLDLGLCGAQFPTSLAAGDFNADGYDDIAAGCPLFPGFYTTINGQVAWFLGGPAGIEFPSDPFDTHLLTVESLLDVLEQGATFGWDLAVGDFNVDGFADLAVGAPSYAEAANAPPGVEYTQGAVVIVWGNAEGLVPGDTPAQLFTQDSVGIPGDGVEGDYFGDSLAVGDFDGNGAADLAIGVPYEVVNDVRAGAVNLLYGLAGLGLTAFSDAGSPLLTQGGSGIQETAEKLDAFGLAVSSGDYNGDGNDDLAVSAPGEDLNVSRGRAQSITDAGVVHAIYGSLVFGLQADDPNDQVWSQDLVEVLDVAESKDMFGQVL
jgi:FG-GAP repeat